MMGRSRRHLRRRLISEVRLGKSPFAQILSVPVEPRGVFSIRRRRIGKKFGPTGGLFSANLPGRWWWSGLLELQAAFLRRAAIARIAKPRIALPNAGAP